MKTLHPIKVTLEGMEGTGGHLIMLGKGAGPSWGVAIK